MTNKTQKIEGFSNEAKEVVFNLTLMGFSPEEIKKYTKKCAEFSEIANEIHSFMCKNWEEIQKVGV